MKKLNNKNKLDVVEYLCDYLPELVMVKHMGFKVPFKLYIEKNGGKGLTLVYQYYSTFLLQEDEEKIAFIDRKGTGEEGKFWWGVRKKFNAPMECIYYCEHIYSLPDLELALKNCYKFLRKHRLIKRREQNVRNRMRIFSMMTSGN